MLQCERGIEVDTLEKEVGALLKKKGLTLCLVESATGGLISHLITDIPGSSDYFKGSITAYSNEAKIDLAGVAAATIIQFGAVSSQVAKEMAVGGRRALKADICLADTGIAGPGGATSEKTVGLFYIALANRDSVSSHRCNFSGDRRENKLKATAAALSWLKEYLLSQG
jgi:nicotinamide-nucleotide amidase